jgi:hypothetical protein
MNNNATNTHPNKQAAVAYEAGRAVVAHLHQLGLSKATISQGKEGWTGETLLDAATPATKVEAARLIAFQAAGRAAQKILGVEPDEKLRASTCQAIEKLARAGLGINAQKLSIDDQTRVDRLIDWGECDAFNKLKSNESFLKKVVKALGAKETLSREEVAKHSHMM